MQIKAVIGVGMFNDFANRVGLYSPKEG